MRFRVLYLVGLTGLLLAACGTVAEPRAGFDPTNTALPRATNVIEDDDQPAEAAAAEIVAATATPLPTLPPTEAPTATLEPTATPTEEVTEEPTQEPTEEPTEVPATEEPAAEGVMVNGVLGDPASGDYWFHNVPNPTTAQMCVTCHNPDEPLTGLGPYLYGIADAAGGRIEGYSAEEYLFESITDPRAFIAPAQLDADGAEVEWPPELMPTDWGQTFDDTQLADLVAYLMTLHAEE